MAKQRFSTGCEFVWRDALYQVRRVLPNSILEVENVITQAAETVAYLDLYKALLDGKLRFAKDGKPLPAPKIMPDLSELSDKERQIAEYRLDVIRPLLNRRSLVEVQARVVEVKEKQARNEMLKSSISQANIYRWIRVYNGSGHDIRSLVDNNYARGGRNVNRINEDVDNIIKATIKDKFFVRTRTTTDAIFDEVLLRIREENKHRTPDDQLSKPSRATVARRIREVDVFAKVTAKRGRKTAKRELRQYGAMDTIMLPMERVEIDHTVVDLIVVDPNDHLPLGRLTITLCIDVATRYPVGYYLGFEPPSYLTVMECLYHAILPKIGLKEKYGLRHEWQAFGVPSTLVVDNGKEFIGRDLQDACAQLGVVIERNPVQSPHLKPMIERLFGTLNTGLFHTVAGTTFSNIFQRGDYNSVKHACISLDELNKILVKFLVEIYAENTHRGLGGIPARAWEQKMMDGFLPYVPNNFSDLLIALGRIEYRVCEQVVRRQVVMNPISENDVRGRTHEPLPSKVHCLPAKSRQALSFA